MDECSELESQRQLCHTENNQQDEAATKDDSDSSKNDEEKRIADSQAMALEKAILLSLRNGSVGKPTASNSVAVRKSAPGERAGTFQTAVENDRKIDTSQLLQPTTTTTTTLEAKKLSHKEKTTYDSTPKTSMASSEASEECSPSKRSSSSGQVSEVVTAVGRKTVDSNPASTTTAESEEYGAFHEAPGLQSRRSQSFSRRIFQQRSSVFFVSAPQLATTADDSVPLPFPMNDVVEANRVEEVVEVEAKPIEWWTPKVVFSLVMLVLTILSIVTGTAVVVATRNPTTISENMPTASPTFSPETRRSVILDILMDAYGTARSTKLYSNNSESNIIETAFDNPDTPQAMALQWLAIDDEFRIGLDDSKHIIQRYVLAVLYYATGGDQWIDSYEFLSPCHECSWSGALRCDVHNGGHEEEGHYHVAGISLRQNNLSGILPDELGMMSSLKSLLVDLNSLRGTLPSSLQELTLLTDLNINENLFSGPVPSQIFTKLTELQIFAAHTNQLTGSIPSEIGRASLMSQLWLQSNFLSGSIPDSLWDLSHMETLAIGVQSLSGTVSPKVGQWLNLTYLHMSKLNGVVGTIPTEMGLLTNLVTLKLSQNHMRGSVPTELGELTKLTKLALSRNGYNGTVPQEFVRLTNLKELYVQNTWMTGDMNFICDAVEDGELSVLGIINADMNEVNCTCCSCCLY